MKKRTRGQRLHLSRETIRSLQEPDYARIVGGTGESIGTSCACIYMSGCDCDTRECYPPSAWCASAACESAGC